MYRTPEGELIYTDRDKLRLALAIVSGRKGVQDLSSTESYYFMRDALYCTDSLLKEAAEDFLYNLFIGLVDDPEPETTEDW